MDIFAGIKNDLRRMGCFQYDHPSKKIINIIIYCSNFMILFISCSSSLCFFIYEAETFNDRVESFIPTICSSIALFTCCCYLWQRKELSELMREFESMIDNRKYSFYSSRFSRINLVFGSKFVYL